MVKFCSRCGNALDDSAKFCSGCGAQTYQQVINNQINNSQLNNNQIYEANNNNNNYNEIPNQNINTSSTRNVAGFKERFIAFLIDYTIGIIIFFIFAWIYLEIIQNGGYELEQVLGMILYFYIPVILLCIRGVLDAKNGSLGRRITKTKVVDGNGNSISKFKSIGRQIFHIMLLELVFVDVLTLICSKEKRSLVDFILNTYVIKKDDQM